MKRRNFFGSLAALVAVPFVKLEAERPKTPCDTPTPIQKFMCKADFCNDNVILRECTYYPSQGVSKVYLLNTDDMKGISFEAKGNWLDYPIIK